MTTDPVEPVDELAVRLARLQAKRSTAPRVAAPAIGPLSATPKPRPSGRTRAAQAARILVTGAALSGTGAMVTAMAVAARPASPEAPATAQLVIAPPTPSVAPITSNTLPTPTTQPVPPVVIVHRQVTQAVPQPSVTNPAAGSQTSGTAGGASTPAVTPTTTGVPVTVPVTAPAPTSTMIAPPPTSTTRSAGS